MCNVEPERTAQSASERSNCGRFCPCHTPNRPCQHRERPPLGGVAETQCSLRASGAGNIRSRYVGSPTVTYQPGGSCVAYLALISARAGRDAPSVNDMDQNASTALIEKRQ